MRGWSYSQNVPVPDDQISVEQISYDSRYTRSRKHRSFCTTSEVRVSVVFGIEKNKQQRNDWTIGEAPSATARFYSNDRNSYNSLDSCARESFKLSRCFSSFSFSRLVQRSSFLGLLGMVLMENRRRTVVETLAVTKLLV